MEKKRNCKIYRLEKRLIAAVLVLVTAVCLCFVVPGVRSFAAGGSVMVSLGDLPDFEKTEDFGGFSFKVYKVGHYDGANFALDGDFDDVNVTIQKEEEYNKTKSEDDPSWQEAWLKSANAMAKHIPDDTEPVYTTDGKIAAGGSFEFKSQENALYLLKGSTERIGNYNWTPVPVFIRTLNGAESFTYNDINLKFDSEKVVFRHTVTKIWNDDNDSAGIRPKTVAVDIKYGDEVIDTVTLGGVDESAKWTYSWTSVETGGEVEYIPDENCAEMSSKGEKATFEPAAESKWDVAEHMTDEDGSATALRYYSPDYETEQTEDEEGAEVFRITNTVTVKSIEIEKLLDGYVDDGQNVVLSFRIDGYEADEDGNAAGDPVWSTHAGIAFGSSTDGEVKDGKVSKTVRIDYVPTDVQVIKVTEEYSGNYKADGEPQITQDGNVWKVVMNNTHDGHKQSGGVVNKYMNGSEPVQEGLSGQSKED